MNFTNALIAGIVVTLLLVSGSMVFIGNLEAHGVDVSTNEYAFIREQNNSVLITNIKDSGESIISSINDTEPQQQGFTNIFSYLSDIGAWFNLVKILFRAVLEVMALPIKLTKYILFGFASAFGITLDVALIIGAVTAIILVMIVGYILYLFIGRGGRRENVI